MEAELYCSPQLAQAIAQSKRRLARKGLPRIWLDELPDLPATMEYSLEKTMKPVYEIQTHVCRASQETGMVQPYAQPHQAVFNQDQPARERCDIVQPMTITRSEAQQGTQRTFHYHGADGKLYSLPVQIPPCPPTGGSLRIPGAGGIDPQTNQRGDLIIALYIIGDQQAKYVGDDLHISVPVTRAMLAQGRTLNLHVRDGALFSFALPPKTSADARFRWAGWGAPSRTKAGYGDLIVTLQCLDPLPAAIVSEKPKTRIQRFGDTLAPFMILLAELGLVVVIVFLIALWMGF
jgi:DnaJ-class molecular chaperone